MGVYWGKCLGVFVRAARVFGLALWRHYGFRVEDKGCPSTLLEGCKRTSLTGSNGLDTENFSSRFWA